MQSVKDKCFIYTALRRAILHDPGLISSKNPEEFLDLLLNIQWNRERENSLNSRSNFVLMLIVFITTAPGLSLFVHGMVRSFLLQRIFPYVRGEAVADSSILSRHQGNSLKRDRSLHIFSKESCHGCQVVPKMSYGSRRLCDCAHADEIRPFSLG
jgi:hypothetical protein